MTRRRTPFGRQKTIRLVVGELLRKIPAQARDLLYLGLVLVALVYVVVGIHGGQLGWDDLLALVGLVSGGVAKANLEPRD